MSGKQEPESPKVEASGRGHLELKDDNTHKQGDDGSLLAHKESFLHPQNALQEKKVNRAEAGKLCQSVRIQEEDEINYSDSDSDDNVTVIIGSIKRNPSLFMEKLPNLNSQTGEDFETSSSGNLHQM
ncbi:PREDICTED: testis-specific protein TSX-like [Chinchilla lanigera]|uniref:testis-specific protein TSX-like n=1 Tax=Chinchilla lanigera TaxID=34839 RepID=UPI0006980A8B|nr:PREDICTED: testis-specific protein TSX-like [Chinchilla lanigera]